MPKKESNDVSLWDAVKAKVSNRDLGQVDMAAQRVRDKRSSSLYDALKSGAEGKEAKADDDGLVYRDKSVKK